MENRFNLIDEPWIPVADVGRVSLAQIFENPDYRALGGNPVQKIALMKLLLAIAQAACTPADEDAWRALGAQGLAEKCRAYLQQWHGRFYLYGERPFLQIPAIKAAALQSYGAVLPEVATGNTTVLNQGQVERNLSDADKALLVLGLMGFALGGKKTDNKVVLTPGYAGKKNKKGDGPGPGLPGPSLHDYGLLHNLLLGENLWQSLWLNLLTTEQIEHSQRYPGGIGTAPWEQMPAGEACPVARALQDSLMGRLVPLCRFCLLAEDGLHYSEGIAHSSYKEGRCDPSVAVNWSGPKALWCNPEKRPWRELTSLLSFIAQQQATGFECQQLNVGINRACEVGTFTIWSGGLRIHKHTTGEQYASGNDDFVESNAWLDSGWVTGEQRGLWFSHLQHEMASLDNLSNGLYGSVKAYFSGQKVKDSKLSGEASHLFWQLCERDFQTLLVHCDADEADQQTHQQARKTLRRRFAGYAQQAYDRYCPKDTARQLDAWASCRPNHAKYLAQEA